MRVLRVVDVPRGQLGGVSLATGASSAALRERGHDVQEWYDQEVAPAALRGKFRQLLSPLWVACRVLRTSGYDVVEVHEPLAWAAALLLRTRPVVVLSHGLEERMLGALAAAGIERPGWLRRCWWALSLVLPNRVAMARAAQVLVLNQDDAAFVRERVPGAEVSCYRNGGGTGPGARSRAPVAPDDVLRVLFMGSWIPRKGSVLTRAVAARCAGTAAVRITVAGDPSPDPCLLGITWRGAFTRAEQAQVLAEHDVLLLPSVFEGMPLAMLEAMHAGLAVVGSAIGGVNDVLDARGTEPAAGVLCPDGDAGAFEAALRALAADRTLLLDLQDRAGRRAREYTWQGTAADLEAAYARALAVVRARRPT